MKWSPEKKVTTSFAVIGGLLLGAATATFGYSQLKNDTEKVAGRLVQESEATKARFSAIERRQESLDSRMAELREMAARQGALLDGIFAYSEFTAKGRKGPPPEVVKP